MSKRLKSFLRFLAVTERELPCVSASIKEGRVCCQAIALWTNDSSCFSMRLEAARGKGYTDKAFLCFTPYTQVCFYFTAAPRCLLRVINCAKFNLQWIVAYGTRQVQGPVRGGRQVDGRLYTVFESSVEYAALVWSKRNCVWNFIAFKVFVFFLLSKFEREQCCLPELTTGELRMGIDLWCIGLWFDRKAYMVCEREMFDVFAVMLKLRITLG